MKAPKCQLCKQLHWPKDGCSIVSVCLECAQKDGEIEALQASLELLQGLDLVKDAQIGKNRRDYARDYMRRRRAG